MNKYKSKYKIKRFSNWKYKIILLKYICFAHLTKKKHTKYVKKQISTIEADSNFNFDSFFSEAQVAFKNRLTITNY